MTVPTTQQSRYEAACDAADTYLQSLNIGHIGEVCRHTRLILARALMEILPQLELDAQTQFAPARRHLLERLELALGGVSTSLEMPNHDDLATTLRLVGCGNSNAQPAFTAILTKLDSGWT